MTSKEQEVCASVPPPASLDLEASSTQMQNPSSNSQADDNEAPSDVKAYPKCFYCPVTQQVMKNPVIHSDGRTFEMDVMTSRKPVYPNRALQSYIELEVRRQEQANSIRGTVQAWNQNILSEIQKLVAPTTYRALPDAFYCPITCDLIYDPVIDPEGTTYEREAILQWIQQHQDSPITRSSLTADQLYDNRAILEALLEQAADLENANPPIQRWKEGYAAHLTAATTKGDNHGSNSLTAEATNARPTRRRTTTRTTAARAWENRRVLQLLTAAFVCFVVYVSIIAALASANMARRS